MASYEKVPSSELEAGFGEHRDTSAAADASVTSTKSCDEEPATSEDTRRRTLSPCQRILVVLFLTSFIAFTFLRGAAVVSVVTIHCMGSGRQASPVWDKEFLQALRASGPDEFCRLYGEGCEEAMASVADSQESSGEAQDPSTEMPGAESPFKISLDKRQENGGNSTSSVDPTASDDIQTSSSAAPEPSTTEGPSSSDVQSTSQLPDETSSSQQQEPSTTSVRTTTVQSTTTQRPTTTTTTTTNVEPTTSEPSSTSATEPTSESTSERPASSSDESETVSTPRSSSSRRTITTGSITTSSAERHIYTTTLPGGSVVVTTSTTYVDFVPTEPTAPSENEPDLQGSASGWQRSSFLQAVMGMAVVAMLLV